MRWAVQFAAAVAAACLGGCSGIGGARLPLVGTADYAALADRFVPVSFDDSSLTGAPYSRDGSSRTEAAIDASGTAVKGLNNVGVSIKAYDESAKGLSLVDRAIFVPSRQHRQQPAVEEVNEQDGAYLITGTILRYPSGQGDLQEYREFRIVGPDCDLRVICQSYRTQRIVTQITGRLVDETGAAVNLKWLDEETYCLLGNQTTGRVREEYTDAVTGQVVYAADWQYAGPLDVDQGRVWGRDITYEPDGFWVATTFDLVYVDEDHASGTTQSVASDGYRVDFTFDAMGGLHGAVYDDLGALVGRFVLRSSLPVMGGGVDSGYEVLLVDEDGDPVTDDEGEIIGFDLDTDPAELL